MNSFSSPCTSVFVCAVILCWDLQTWKYAFVNLTQCTPSALVVRSNVQLISLNHRGRSIKDADLVNGFICSSCTRANFVELDRNDTGKRCHAESTLIQLAEYCQYSSQLRNTSRNCQCSPADQPIQRITDWKMAVGTPGKGDRNSLRVNRINQSAAASVYLLIAFVFALMLLGGLVSAIVYTVKLRSCPRKWNK